MTADAEINALKPESPKEATDGSFIIVNGGDPKELELDVGERLDQSPVSASVNGLRGDLEEKEGEIHEVHDNGVECDGVGEKKEAEDGKLGSVVDVEVDQRPNVLIVAEEIRDPKEEEHDNVTAPENCGADAEAVIEVVAGKEQEESVHETFTVVKAYEEEAESAPTKKEEEKIDGEEAFGPGVQLQEEEIEKDVLLKSEEVKPDGGHEIDEAESGESHHVVVTQTEAETNLVESNYFVVSKIDEEAKLEESHEIEVSKTQVEVQLEENHEVVVTKADDESRSEESSEENQDHAGSGTAADENVVAGPGNDEVEVMKERVFDEIKPVEIDATQENEHSQNQSKLESEVKVEGSSEVDVVEVEVMNEGVIVVSESTTSEFMTVENQEPVSSDVALAVQKSEALGEQDDIPAQLQKDGSFVDFDTANHGSQDEASPENVDVADVACTDASPGSNGIQADEIQMGEALPENSVNESQTEASHENGVDGVPTDKALHKHGVDEVRTADALHEDGVTEVQTDEALHENGLAKVQTDEALHEHDVVVIQSVEALHKNGAAEVQTDEALHENGLAKVQTDEALHEHDVVVIQTVEALNKNGAAEVQTDEALHGNDVVEVQTVDTVHESGVEQSSRDGNLVDNGVATEGRIEAALEAGSKNLEDGDAALLADGKQVDLIAGNGSEVGTSTDIDEHAPYTLADELRGSSDEVDPTASKEDDGKPNSEEIEVIKEIVSSPKEEACSSGLDGERSLKQRAYWLIKVPWIHDAEKAAQVKNARCQLEELTKARDEIKAATRVQRETFKKSYELLEDAKIKEKAARNALAAKRKEIDSVQSVLEKMKNATSIDNICDQIQTMERMIEHETMPLSQEKQYLNEIKRLKLRKEQLFSNMGPQADIQEAFDQKDQIENQAKILKKELEALRTEVMQAENTRKTALKISNDERLRLIDLIEKQRLAYVHREEAYELFSKLNKENQHHTEYMVDRKAAESFVASGDVEKLGCHCDDQIEKVMKLWNADNKFRKQYAESNMKSLWRRFKTLDGRSLGPGEEPHVLPSSEVKRSGNESLLLTKDSISVQVSAPESEQENVGAVKVPEKASSAFSELVQINQSAVPRNATKSIPRATTVIVSNYEEAEDGKGDITETKEEEEKRKKAEELAKKDEELRKEKLEIELKEQCRLEQRAKAKDAEERKRRQAEKAQARAELKAQKEAELKEKKRAKKVKKKAAAVETTNGSVEGASDAMESTAPETAQEPETTVTINSKRSSRPLTSAKKYNKIQPIPLPLRKKGKRKMQTWMWVVLVSLLILAIFFTGDYLPSLIFNLPSLGF